MFPIRGKNMMRGFGSYQNFDGYGMMGNLGWFGMLVMLLIIILVIIGIVFLFRSLFSYSNRANFSSSNNRSIEILKERLAKGEITKEEYETIKKSL